MIYLDTHVVVWLYAGETARFADAGIELIEEHELMISPIVQLELTYLNEIGRLDATSALMIETLAASVGLVVCVLPFIQVIAESVRQSWTRDPFDRLIVAQATCRSAPLLSKDESIRSNYAATVW